MNTFDELSTPVPVSEGSQVSGEVGPASGVVAGSNQAATGAGNGPGGVVPVPVAALEPDDLLVCGHRAPYGRGPKSVQSACGQCGTWRAYAGSTRAESALRPGGESGERSVSTASVAADLNLDEIRARAEAATKGPWIAGSRVSSGAGRWRLPVLNRHDGEDGPITDQIAVVTYHAGAFHYPHHDAQADAEFIAHAREDIPALLAEVERLRGLEPRWGSGPLVDHNPETPAPEVWSGAVAPGGYVCGALDPNRPDGICGMPVESEPCPEHITETPGTGSADPDGGQ